MDRTGIPEWDEAFRVLCCLKESEEKQTYLLEERNGLRRLICKVAEGGQAVFLRREYEILTALSGPWKPRTAELREDGARCALLRDYVEGTTLAELVETEGVLDADEAARLALGLCRVLEALHRETPPVIHRDLKPENVLVTPGGKIRLIDFETARFYKPERETDTVCLGTRGYAAPEQFGYGQTDSRTDIYAVGKILLYLVTGDCETEFVPAGGREKALAKVIRRCCAYDPSRRYADADALERALRPFAQHRSPALRRFLPAAVILLCLLSGIGGAALGWRAGRERQMDGNWATADGTSSAEGTSLEEGSVDGDLSAVGSSEEGSEDGDLSVAGSADGDLLDVGSVDGDSSAVGSSEGTSSEEGSGDGDSSVISSVDGDLSVVGSVDGSSSGESSADGIQAVAWNPYVYRENVDEIIRLLRQEDYAAMISACETLVETLRGRDLLREIEPVAFWDMEDEEREDYNSSRQGYEYIADRLAYQDCLSERRLGSYEAHAASIARRLRSGIDYTWRDEDGTTHSSALHEYAVLGDDRNMDGCIIEILDAVNYGLEDEE